MKKAIPFRLTAEIAFFYSIIGVLPHFTPWHPQMTAFLAATFLAGLLAERIKIMPLRALIALLPGALLFTGKISFLLFIPALALLYFVIASAKQGTVILTDYRRVFLAMLGISGFALLLGIVNTFVIEKVPMSPFSIVFPAVFLLLGISALRLMQMGDSAGTDLHVAGIVTAVSAIFLSVAGSFLLYFIIRLSLPVLGLLGKPLVMLFKYISGLFPDKETVVNEDLIMDVSDEVVDIGEIGPGADEAALSTSGTPNELLIPPVSGGVLKVLLVIGIIVAAVIVVYIVIRLAKRGDDERSDIYFEETKSFLGKKKRSRRTKNQVQLSPVKAVRRIYREYLDYLSKNGITRNETDTSGEILIKSEAVMTSDKDSEEELRKIYLKARYSEETVTQNDVSEAKRFFELITKR